MYAAVTKVVSTTRNTTWGAKGEFSFKLNSQLRAQLSGSADERALAPMCHELVDSLMSKLGPYGFKLVPLIEMLTTGPQIKLQHDRLALGTNDHNDRMGVTKLLLPLMVPRTGRGLRFRGGGAPPNCIIQYPRCGAILGGAAGFNTVDYGGTPGLTHASVAGTDISMLMVLRFKMPSALIDVSNHPSLDFKYITGAATSAATTFDYRKASLPLMNVRWVEVENAEVRARLRVTVLYPKTNFAPFLVGGSHAECHSTRSNPRLGGHHGARIHRSRAVDAERCYAASAGPCAAQPCAVGTRLSGARLQSEDSWRRIWAAQ